MVSKLALLLGLCCFLFSIRFNNACQNFRTTDELEIEEVEEVEEVGDRRRRGRSKTEKTVPIRDYFTSCMATLLVGATYDWRSCVDFTILDSLWYLNTEQTYCSPGGDGDTLECWQEEITNFLKKSPNRVLETAQTCIAHFAEDKNSLPPRNRYKRRKQLRGRRTTASSGSYIVPSSGNYFSSSYSYASSMYGYNYLPTYTTCLTTLTFDDRRAPLNFRNLSLFIDENTVDGCSMRNRPRRGNGPSWPYRFVSLTRPDSALRNELELCAKRVYPPSPYWTSWGAFGSCSVTCGKGRQIKRRSCRSGVNPRELSSGCRGSSRDVKECNKKACSKFSWGRWGSFSKCSKSCGRGFQLRRRPCRRNGKRVDVQKCKNINGVRLERRICNSKICQEKFSWTSWSPYSRCKKSQRTNSCRKGIQTRSRRCLKGKRQAYTQASSRKCNGVDTEHRPCSLNCSTRSSSSLGLISRFPFG